MNTFTRCNLVVLLIWAAVPLGARAADAPAPTADPDLPKCTDARSAVDPETLAKRTAIAQSSNAFALDLWRLEARASSNLTMSPASIAAAMAMTWGGARGQTARQMASVMHFSTDVQSTSQTWRGMLCSLTDPHRNVTLRMANRLFASKTFALDRSFIQWTKQTFAASLESMDFRNAADASRIRINAWVTQQTQGQIANLLGPRAINAQSRLVLVDSVYFRGDWAHSFSRKATIPEPFFVSRSIKRDIPMMHMRKGFEVAHVDGVRLLNLDYRGGDVSMLIVLPDRIDGLASVESTLSVAWISAWRKALRHEEVVVSLPRFDIDMRSPLSLGRDLATLGMQDAFDPSKADFSGMAKPLDPKDRLVLSNVFHQALVKVDEEGTVAAAATAVIMGLTASYVPNTTPPFLFRADHPFLLFVIDKPTGLILFMGHVNDPSVQ